MKKICFFDVETQLLFRDIGNIRDPTKLKLALAGIAFNDEPVQLFTEQNVLSLLDALQKSDYVIGHNILGFDYLVLQPYDKKQLINQIIKKSFDIMKEIRRKTGPEVSFVGLNDLAKLNLGMTKNEDTLKIPAMWKAGKIEEVEDYLRNDIEILRSLFNLIKEKKRLKYTHKEFGEIIGIKEIELEFVL
jgi:uncharacterized protein YprB with RNaseH-like and TPR domain